MGSVFAARITRARQRVPHACSSIGKSSSNTDAMEEMHSFFCPGPFGFCDKNAPAWECWRENIPRKTRGYWVSTLKEGMCTASSPPGSCSWRVERTTTVDEKCLRNSIMSTVEASAPGCFTGCGPRNETSTCWIDCFFDAILGREARTSNLLPLGGVALDDLQKAWEKAFAPTWEGGCPVISMADT